MRGIVLNSLLNFKHASRLRESPKLCFSTFFTRYKQLFMFELFALPKPDFDYGYLSDPKLTSDVRENIRRRKGVGDIDKVLALHNEWTSNGAKDDELRKILLNETKQIPNQSHPKVKNYDEDPVIVELVAKKKEFAFKPRQFDDLATSFDAFRTKNIGVVTGPRTYYLKGVLVQLEKALIKYTLNHLLRRNFQLVSVPDLLPPAVIEGCGMNVLGERTQVYTLNPEYYGEVCLSGTSEMALAAMYANKVLPQLKSPIRLVAVSRCFRAEVSDKCEEKGIYRVHHFTKVEMFGITAAETGCESDALLEEFLTIQKELFSSLGLHFKVLDMPPCELGAPAFRKFDIEAWMPGRGMYGEISSCSSCTDYQSRRLHILYEGKDGDCKHAHTVNGTACAIPRMLIAILENFQEKDGSVVIPKVLRPYLNNVETFRAVPKVKRGMRFLTSLPKNISSEEQNG